MKNEKIIDRTDGKLMEAIKLSRKLKDLSLIKCLQSLKKVGNNHEVRHIIFQDFAPYSFYFIREKNNIPISNGGIIFHGKHDGFGSGSAPTFSVSLTKTNGWQIHT